MVFAHEAGWLCYQGEHIVMYSYHGNTLSSVHNPVLHICRVEELSCLIKAVKLFSCYQKNFSKVKLMVLICVCVFVCVTVCASIDMMYMYVYTLHVHVYRCSLVL